jgi:hypothetical protein
VAGLIGCAIPPCEFDIQKERTCKTLKTDFVVQDMYMCYCGVLASACLLFLLPCTFPASSGSPPPTAEERPGCTAGWGATPAAPPGKEYTDGRQSQTLARRELKLLLTSPCLEQSVPIMIGQRGCSRPCYWGVSTVQLDPSLVEEGVQDRLGRQLQTERIYAANFSFST